jgi:hypothetical protein
MQGEAERALPAAFPPIDPISRRRFDRLGDPQALTLSSAIHTTPISICKLRWTEGQIERAS